MTARTEETRDKLCDGIETVKGFCYLGNSLIGLMPVVILKRL